MNDEFKLLYASDSVGVQTVPGVCSIPPRTCSANDAIVGRMDVVEDVEVVVVVDDVELAESLEWASEWVERWRVLGGILAGVSC